MKYVIHDNVKVVRRTQAPLAGRGLAYMHVTNKCNLNCIGCYSRNESRNRVPDLLLEQLRIIISELSKNGFSTLVISGGEPLLRDDLPQLVAWAKTAGIGKITIETNGTCVDLNVLERLNHLVDRIDVGIDGYETRGPHFLRDKGSTRYAVKAILQIQSVGIPVAMVPTLHRKNTSHIDAYRAFAEELGVPVVFNILTGNPNIPPLDEYVLTDEDLQALACLNQGTIHGSLCDAGTMVVSIDATGNVFPCRMLHDDEFCLGNLLDEPLESILRSERTRRFCATTFRCVLGCKFCNHRYVCSLECKERRHFPQMGYSTSYLGTSPLCSCI